MLKTKSETMKVLGRNYREKIQIQQYQKTPDGQGGYESQWVVVTTVGAYFKKPSLRTMEEAGTVISEMNYEIKIQDRPSVAGARKGWRVLRGSGTDQKTYEIEHVYNDDYDLTKVLICREVVK